MLNVRDLCWAAPDGRPILDHVRLDLPDHRMIAISGPNGSGKTTLARLLMGMEAPSAGKIYLDGRDITGLDVTQRAGLGISFGFQQPVCFKGITVRRLLSLAAGHPVTEAGLCQLLQTVGLCAKNYLNRDIDSTLSGGEMKRIEIASILARDTAITILDEPEAGIDLWSFEKLIGVFEAMKAKGRTLVVISHQERILSIADEIVLLEGGRVASHGPGPEMLAKLTKRSSTRCCGLTEVH